MRWRPAHSKYNPIEHCWGVLESHWNGTLLNSVATVVEWARTMTWRGVDPIAKLIETTYCEPTTHRSDFTDSASFSFCRLGPTTHRSVPSRDVPLLLTPKTPPAPTRTTQTTPTPHT